MKLGQIASIRLGYSFRSKLQPMNEGNFFVLSMKDLNHSGNFELSKLPRVYLKKINSDVSKEIIKLLKKFNLTEVVKIVHSLTGISKKDIYQMAIKLKDD